VATEGRKPPWRVHFGCTWGRPWPPLQAWLTPTSCLPASCSPATHLELSAAFLHRCLARSVLNIPLHGNCHAPVLHLMRA